MVDDQSVDVQTLVVGVGLSVLQQLEQEVGGLLGPATDRCSPLLGLSGSADAAVVPTEWNALLVLGNVLQETLSTTEGHALDSKCRLAGVLQSKEVDVDGQNRVENNFNLFTLK